MPAVPQGCPLSARQFECLVLLADGCSYKDIAARLRLANSTVRSHLHAIYKHLDVPNSNGAVSVAGRRGWIGWKAPEPSVDTFPPLLKEHPFLAAYLATFEQSRWPAQEPDDTQRLAMHHALEGHAYTVMRERELRRRRRAATFRA